ncbi:MAG: T9SS type A sorting domain-containing protein [Ignavibacteriales bacterium]|nr:T9SS type A sorting domain-containing protein [Ignavibacteriales bacterium]
MKIKKANLILILVTALIFIDGAVLNAQQISISTIEKMQNAPSPYSMRNWKKVAAGYDSLVFNSSLSGQYLPLIFDINNTVNYPGQRSFGINSYVGTYTLQQGEAINVLPAIIGASLIGIDKSNPNVRNYVLESREYFNKRPEENIYLNQPVVSSGSDWWYETMPNVFFYQLYSLYPGTPEFNNQFTTVADRWLQAVYAMGAATTPWKIPGMNYRAWNFSLMTPNASGVPEPEASGAIAWILYNAFTVTGEQKYRIGAELAMEYLNSLGSNPAYEIQLPYGTYLAARMNAELGTNYDIEKMVNWCFDLNQRSWGATTGDKWGVNDVNGLIGELEPRNYAFAMNTFEQIGALVPLVRYDSRFARAIGKWVLNAANSSRLFYSNYLLDTEQDSRSWAEQYDPNSVIAYEALLKTDSKWIKATGDAVSNGWAATNLGLYGSSHVGILGAIIDTTNVSMILKLDLLKTDYFHKSAYPSFLIFNSYNIDKDVLVDVGSNNSDIYDAVSHAVIASNVKGITSFTIPADQAIIAVIIPAGSSLNFELGKTLVNGTIIDYKNGLLVLNYPPRIKSLSSAKINITVHDSTNIYCTAMDREGQQLSYQWKASGGNIVGSGSTVKWKPPNSAGIYSLSVIVDDPPGAKDSAQINITVSWFINYPPVINKIKASPRKINIGSSSGLSCDATDLNGDSLAYSWSASYGILAGSGKNISWEAPVAEGNYYIKCTVTDTHSASVTDSLGVEVRDSSNNQTGSLIAFYPFNGNGDDQTGNHHNGIVNGAFLTKDRFGNPDQAYSFDGVTNNIQILNSSSLNFGGSITISLWFKIGTLFNREAFLISHGSWQKRWKISVTNRKIRWTIKTDSNVNDSTKDLDSETELLPNKLYLVTVTYSGADMELWLNGELDSFTSRSGKILQTSYNLTIAQMLPENTNYPNYNNYNFSGIIDDVRLYDYALPIEEILKLFDIQTSVKNSIEIPSEFRLYQNYPNPFNPSTVINYRLVTGGRVILKVYDILGREVVTLVDEYQNAGIHNSQFSILNSQLSSGVYFYQLRVGDHFVQSKKMLLIK